MFQHSSTALATLLLVICSGCFESGPKTVPVYGKVTFVGRETPKVCRLFFRPVQSEGLLRPCAAATEPDGTYQVKAFQQSKGLVPGTYRIRVSYFDLKPGANPELDTSWVETRYDAGELVVDADSSGIEHNIEVPKKS
jgi:hypothetical protein